ncbi:MAG: ParB/RepB/Spo0J family partition protein [Clostridia bacterium]|nr:ParB/RepB/Spo0J family partition protein [Clostridia bacterium]MDD4145818.1 ParB/RepB/Spo0J family partition protein [Clostridia bacterium]MDD4665330.1 ParB/RepB/Spo0J family partition protein [Clostridia bacterium]
MGKTGLGKGLAALIPVTTEVSGEEEAIATIKMSAIVPNAFQPRRVFDEDKLKELATSIQEHGVVQPIVVRQLAKGKYELVVGERRVRACQILGKEEIPAVIKEYTNEQMMEIALVENIQRQDLNPIEEAGAYKRLLTEFNYTQEQVAQKVSKSRPFVANMVRLLNLPQRILDQLVAGELTIGHARPLLAIVDQEQQIKAAQEIIEKKMTVREAEELVREITENKNKKKNMENKRRANLPPEILDIETRLREVCGTKVLVKAKGKKGKIEINYYSNDDLNRILAIFFQEDFT